MRTNYFLLLICLCMGIFISCNSENTFKVDDLNGKWNIISVRDEPINLEKMPFFEFDVAEKKVHGNTSCNILNSTFETDANDTGAIKFAMPISTMMACINLDTEVKILQVISEITHVTKGETPNRINLVDKDGNIMLVLEKI